ncbi:hypothetical protein SEVIR_2G153033v4 [Setaria viridis]
MPHLKQPGSSCARAAEPYAVNRKRVDVGRHASSSPSVRSGASSSGSSGGAASGGELLRPRPSAAGARVSHCGEFQGREMPLGAAVQLCRRGQGWRRRHVLVAGAILKT